MQVADNTLTGLKSAFDRMDDAAARMTPNNPEGLVSPLLQRHEAKTEAQAVLAAFRHWNENIGRLLDILA